MWDGAWRCKGRNETEVLSSSWYPSRAIHGSSTNDNVDHGFLRDFGSRARLGHQAVQSCTSPQSSFPSSFDPEFHLPSSTTKANTKVKAKSRRSCESVSNTVIGLVGVVRSRNWWSRAVWRWPEKMTWGPVRGAMSRWCNKPRIRSTKRRCRRHHNTILRDFHVVDGNLSRSSRRELIQSSLKSRGESPKTNNGCPNGLDEKITCAHASSPRDESQ